MSSPTTPQSRVRVNSAMLIMGPTGSGKSSLLGTGMEYVYETFQMLTHFVTVDGGGFPTKIQGLIQKGICLPWRARTRDLPDGSLSFETCLRAAQGWWPKRLNHQTGECPPGVQLVPPITERYEMRCPSYHLVKIVPFQALLTPAMCPVCKTHTTKENMRVVKTSGQTKGFERVGAVMFDGWTSMLSWMLSDMGQRAGRLELKGEEGAIGGKIISGDLKLGGNTRSHIGFAQSRAEELVLNSLGIPNLVIPPIFTALTDEATDEGGLSIKGPKLAGHARTADGPSWVGNCLESEVRKTDKDERQYRLNLAEYTDASGVRHLCKHRGAPGTLPAYLEDPPITEKEAETAFTQFNVGVFIQLLERSLQQTLTEMDEKYPSAPGVAEGWVEVGESTSASASDPGTAQAKSAPTPIPPSGSAAPSAPSAPATPAVASKPAGAPKAPPAPAVRAKAPVRRPVGAKPVAPAPPVQPAQQTNVVQPQPSGATQTTTSAPMKAFAPPGAPRPPAPAPRLRPQTSK